MKKFPFHFYVLPENVWLDERISSGAKFLLGILLRYCDEGYWIERPNKWYGERMKVKEREVNYRMGELLRAGYIEKSRSEGRPNRVKVNIGIWLKATPAQTCTPAHPLQDSPAYDVQPIHIFKENIKEKNTTSSASPRFPSSTKPNEFKQVVEYFSKRVQELYGVNYVPSWGRDGAAYRRFRAVTDTWEKKPPPEDVIDFYFTLDKSRNHFSLSAAFSADTLNQYQLEHRDD